MTDLSTNAKRKLEELKQDYVYSLPEKMLSLEQCWKNDDLDGLRMLTHKIAGSAASFGLPEISFAARTLESLCKTRQENQREKITEIEQDKTLKNSYTVLMKAFEKNTNRCE